jgi:hypothetical protein
MPLVSTPKNKSRQSALSSLPENNEKEKNQIHADATRSGLEKQTNKKKIPNGKLTSITIVRYCCWCWLLLYRKSFSPSFLWWKYSTLTSIILEDSAHDSHQVHQSFLVHFHEEILQRTFQLLGTCKGEK